MNAVFIHFLISSSVAGSHHGSVVDEVGVVYESEELTV